MSMILYTINADPLARSIKMNDRIKGFKIGQHEMKIQQYADDTTITVKEALSFKTVLQEFDNFKEATGQKLNVEKTEIICSNKKLEEELQYFTSMGYIKPYVKILGHIFDYRGNDDHWQQKIRELEKLTNIFRNRDLSWMGKITILNSLAVSKLMYSGRIELISSKILDRVNRIFFQFLWFPQKKE